MKRNDIFIIVGVLIVAGVLYVLNQYRISQIDTNHIVANIYVDGELYKTLPINEEKEITIKTKYGTNVISIHDHGAEMVHANCPDHLCEKVGFIGQVGNRIVCLPNRVYVEIVGDVEEEVDAISE